MTTVGSAPTALAADVSACTIAKSESSSAAIKTCSLGFTASDCSTTAFAAFASLIAIQSTRPLPI
jgi:hypothetical protein